MQFIADRPFNDPDAAARKLLDIVRASINESGLRYAYTGATNTAFTRAGGSVEEYSIGMKHAAAHKSTDQGRVLVAGGWCGIAMYHL